MLLNRQISPVLQSHAYLSTANSPSTQLDIHHSKPQCMHLSVSVDCSTSLSNISLFFSVFHHFPHGTLLLLRGPSETHHPDQQTKAINWIPIHTGIPANEKVENEAKKGLQLDIIQYTKVSASTFIGEKMMMEQMRRHYNEQAYNDASQQTKDTTTRLAASGRSLY